MFVVACISFFDTKYQELLRQAERKVEEKWRRKNEKFQTSLWYNPGGSSLSFARLATQVSESRLHNCQHKRDSQV